MAAICLGLNVLNHTSHIRAGQVYIGPIVDQKQTTPVVNDVDRNRRHSHRVCSDTTRHEPESQTQIYHYIDVITGSIASQITSLTIVYSTAYSGADQRKHQSSASLAFVWGIHRDQWIARTNGQ